MKGRTTSPTPEGPTRSGVSNERNRRKHGRRCGVPLYIRDRRGYGSVVGSLGRNGWSYLIYLRFTDAV